MINPIASDPSKKPNGRFSKKLIHLERIFTKQQVRPWKGCQAPNGKDRLPSIIFQGLCSISGVYQMANNMEPEKIENDGLEDDFPFQLGDF